MLRARSASPSPVIPHGTWYLTWSGGRTDANKCRAECWGLAIHSSAWEALLVALVGRDLARFSEGAAPGRWTTEPEQRRVLGVGEGRIRTTWGWISVDRGSKATLPLTMPRRVFKSSAKDSARRPWGRELRGGLPRLVGRTGLASGTGPWGASTLTWVGAGGGHRRRLLARILT